MDRNDDPASANVERHPERTERLQAPNLVARSDLPEVMRDTIPSIGIKPKAPDDTAPCRAEGFDADLTFLAAIDQSLAAVSFADPYLPGRPLVHVTAGFEALTGYKADECIGRSCGFLQGPETDAEAVAAVRQALGRAETVSVELVNYRKDGSTFLNHLRVGPIHDEAGRLRYFFGTQVDGTEKRTLREAYERSELIARESAHRMRNLIQLADAIVGRTLREQGVPHLREKVTDKLVAIADAHAASIAMPGRDGADLVTLAQVTLAPFGAVPGLMCGPDETDAPVTLSGPRVHLAEANVATVALILNELATNSVKHGALRVPDGRVSLTWRPDTSGAEPRVVLTWHETRAQLGEPHADSRFANAGGPGGSGLGKGIMDRLIADASGTIERHSTADGLKVEFTTPCDLKR